MKWACRVGTWASAVWMLALAATVCCALTTDLHAKNLDANKGALEGNGADAKTLDPTKSYVLLSFPDNVSVGRLFLALPNSGGGGFRSDKKLIAEGRGLVRLPAGTFVELKLSYDGVANAAVLSKLDPGPFVTLDCRSLDNLDDQTLKYIGHLSNLSSLSLIETDTTDRGIENLSPLTKLRQLDLQQTLITGKTLSVLKNFSQLRILHLSFNKLNDTYLSNLALLKDLRELDLQVTGIGDSALPSVAACPKLEWLNLGKNKNITDGGLVALKKLTKLRSINVAGTSVTAKGVEQLKELPLTTIDFNMKSASQDELVRLAKIFPQCKLKSGPHSQRPPELYAPLK
jgi:Leucine Rich repeat